MLIYALRQQDRLTIHCEPFADPLLPPRGERQQALQQAVDRYAQRLETRINVAARLV
jgi:predicted LPLAT superfamily acyltransferase